MYNETQTISSIQSTVREETEDGRLIVQFLVMAMQDEIRDVKPCHRLDAARQLIKLGFEEAKELAKLPATSPQRIQPADQPQPKADAPTDTIDTNGLNPDLARFIRAETDGGRRAVRFLVDIMLGYLPWFKPHHRRDAPKELPRRGFDDAPYVDHTDYAGHDQDSETDEDSPAEASPEYAGRTLDDYEPPYVNTYGHSANNGHNNRAVFNAADALMDAVGRLKPPADKSTLFVAKKGSTIVHNGNEHYFNESACSSVELGIATGEVLDAIKRIRESCRQSTGPWTEPA